MYLLSAAGNFDCRVTLDKEGPIHDFAWSPNSKEFGVVYGCKLGFSLVFHLTDVVIPRYACKDDAVRPALPDTTRLWCLTAQLHLL